ncbi:MAG: hypothetical protein L3K00_08730 [Thermoplasmata archaeon]|nr:hypothetical protein [Thermoplasmata archaeon]
MSVRFGLVLGGTVVALFALAMFGAAGLGTPAAPMAKTNAGLATAATASCPATVATTFGPSVITTHSKMTVNVSVVFAPSDPASCARGVQYQFHGLPPGCLAGTTASFVCVPTLGGTFHVLTTVVAQNTATTVVDTLVVV